MHMLYTLMLDSPVSLQNELIPMHPFYILFLNSPVSPQNEPIQMILPMFDLLMMIPPADAVALEDDVAAIFGSSIGVLLPLLDE